MRRLWKYRFGDHLLSKWDGASTTCHEKAVNSQNRRLLTVYLVFDECDTLLRLLWGHTLDDHVPPMQHLTSIVRSVRQWWDKKLTVTHFLDERGSQFEGRIEWGQWSLTNYKSAPSQIGSVRRLSEYAFEEDLPPWSSSTSMIRSVRCDSLGLPITHKLHQMQ